ncbi:MAG: hypothetical protein IPL77_18045 [Flavobacteriales bacterium]|nr:hypothetical protein [Flavobacteriales bacterium]
MNTEFDNEVHAHGSLAWTHSLQAGRVRPFNNISLIGKEQVVEASQDFNFNLGFKQLSLRTAIDRSYSERMVQPASDIASLPPRPTYNKNFNWNSQYGFPYENTQEPEDQTTSRTTMRYVGEPPSVWTRK